ncbi:MAG: hypothetical protein IJP43_00915 [Oscillospiraceae bacterium]|nr:hypothetical protein [Oscillospiraceae bacterium]
MTAVNESTYREPTKTTVKARLEFWLKKCLGSAKYQTKKHYEAESRVRIIPALGNVKLSELTPMKAQLFLPRE